MSYTYDTNNYYKLIADAKTKETKKVPLGSVPHLESLKRDVVTGTVYYYLRTDYKETTIRKVVPKRVFSDECDVMNELMSAGFDLTPATVNGFMDVVFSRKRRYPYSWSIPGWDGLKGAAAQSGISSRPELWGARQYLIPV